MTRRTFLGRLSIIFLTSLAGLGIYSATGLFPRPPKKIFIRKKDLEGKKLVIKDSFFLSFQKGKLLALSRTCPHLGCKVTYDPHRKLFVCPCHQSRFTLTGKYLSGPAKKDLQALTIKKTEGGYILEIPA